MIKVRLKFQPDEVKTYSSRKEILDLERWGMVLEIVHDDDAPVLANDEGLALPDPEVFVNDSGEPEDVWTLEQLELLNESSSEHDSEDEQE